MESQRQTHGTKIQVTVDIAEEKLCQLVNMIHISIQLQFPHWRQFYLFLQIMNYGASLSLYYDPCANRFYV